MIFKNHKNLAICLGFIAVSFCLFGNGIKGDFVFDDNLVIVGNPILSDFNKIPELFVSSYHYKQPGPGLYRPLTVISYSLNEIIFGESTVSFHAVNIILHALVAFSLFLLLELLFKDKRLSLLAATLFLFIPIHVEAVTSIIGRAELLAAFFVLLALYFYLKNNIWLSSGAFLMGLLSKEHAIAFLGLWLFMGFFLYKWSPTVLQPWHLSKQDSVGRNPASRKPLHPQAYAWGFLGRGQKISLLVKKSIYYGIVLAIYFSLRYIALKEYFLSNDATLTQNPIKHIPIIPGLFTSFKVSFLYLKQTVFPTVFSSDYSYDQIKVVNNIFNSPEALAGFLILIAMVFTACWKRNSAWGLAAAFFIIPYFIVSNFVFKIGTIMAERLVYLPSIGIAIMLALGLKYLFDRKKLKSVGWVIFAALIIFYSFKTVDRNKDWLTEKALYESAYASAHDSVMNIAGIAYILAIKENNPQAAKEYIDKALAIAPDNLTALNLGAQIYNLLNDKNKAEYLWGRSIELKPTYLRGLRNLGQFYYENDRLKEAELMLEKAIDIYPRRNEVFLLSLTKTKLKKYDEAIVIIEKHFGEDPEILNLKFALGLAYYRMGDGAKAKFYFDQSRNPEVSEEDFIKALDNL
ncbi:MAG: hypothetical protein Q8R55_00155 [Candidatus Taylorbacteria bacterium]|nr:hypothetical protein [Candidatus Taylorbacteria bacterium]